MATKMIEDHPFRNESFRALIKGPVGYFSCGSAAVTVAGTSRPDPTRRVVTHIHNRVVWPVHQDCAQSARRSRGCTPRALASLRTVEGCGCSTPPRSILRMVAGL